jgi:hypothetical protein
VGAVKAARAPSGGEGSLDRRSPPGRYAFRKPGRFRFSLPSFARMGRPRKMPRKATRIVSNAGKAAEVTQSLRVSMQITCCGLITGSQGGYPRSSGFISSSSSSARLSGERGVSGVSGGKGESCGGALASLSRRTGCSSQFMRRALNGGKLW